MDKLQKRIRQVEEQVAEEHVQDHLDYHQQKLRDKALLIVGGFKTATRIANAINSEVMRALELFQEEKVYQAFGYSTFVDFLEESEHSPMSKTQYYERRSILEKEGDAMFDLLSGLGMSIRKRKLLGRGNVEFDGDKVIVHDGDEQTEIEITDRTRLLETLTALADANADKSAKLEKQKVKLDKHDAEKREIYDELDRVKASKAAEIGKDPHSVALANVCFAFAALRDEIAALNTIDAEARCTNTLEILAGQMSLTSRAYGGSSDWAAEVRTGSDSDRVRSESDSEFDWDAAIDAAAGGEDNDAELAASM